MSEAILYAIDAPHITDAVTAAGFVDQFRDSNEAPTAGIASFFDNLLRVWPEDGSKGAVWNEDFAHNRPAGSVLEMTFELSEFDEERLGQLRAIAEQHGVHVLDPEGEVLYLADGSEAGA
ncbi:hypothetical protein [Pseudoxanthomonas sacheonensis]|uniref:Uncharacterized protein n=1 Tax=Pseudoxanthomonas sacheonensis TaxID=443615 RepID=A0ABU1RTF1_9GAMM|nr:hypothetical protein [Pseudoxanthomonas sacheonensis]MDR6841190.1 hypothetical protein [Pseudoxanthomonas sacheonensis]